MHMQVLFAPSIVALRDERGSYNIGGYQGRLVLIVALRDERGSYNRNQYAAHLAAIVALRDERGSYNRKCKVGK